MEEVWVCASKADVEWGGGDVVEYCLGRGWAVQLWSKKGGKVREELAPVGVRGFQEVDDGGGVGGVKRPDG